MNHRVHYILTCSRSSLSLWSCDSSCLLWSSRICIRVSKRLLCCRRTRASARSSSSCWSSGELNPERPSTSCGAAAAASSCFHLSRRYSLCSILHSHSIQTSSHKKIERLYDYRPHTRSPSRCAWVV